jgi:hypothetical protein
MASLLMALLSTIEFHRQIPGIQGRTVGIMDGRRVGAGQPALNFGLGFGGDVGTSAFAPPTPPRSALAPVPAGGGSGIGQGRWIW